MSVRISHIPFYGKKTIPDVWLWFAGIAYLVPAGILMTWKTEAGLMAATLPVAAFLSAHGFSAILVLIGASFLYLPLYGSIAPLPADLAAFVVIAAYAIDLSCRGPVQGKNVLAMPYLFLLAVMLVAMALEGFTSLSVKYCLRQLVLAGTFFAVAHFGRRVGRTMLNLFLAVAALNSLYSLFQYMQGGGNIRTFGLSGLGFGDHAMLAALISGTFFLWSRDWRAKILYVLGALVVIGALAATQTRASAMTAGWGFMIAAGVSLLAGRKVNDPTPARNFALALIVLLIAAPFLILYTPIFEGMVGRFGEIGWQASGTIVYRVSLWKAALSAFWINPVWGIGPGNFPLVGQWVPEVRFDRIFYFVSGMSTHSVLMTTLAETGLAGLAALVFFFWRAAAAARRNLLETALDADLPVNIVLLVGTLAIIGSSLYAGSWFWGSNSYHMAVIFGLVAAERRTH